MTERTKIFTVAHITPGLEREWLQHLRDFDTAHEGCHFEVITDVPDAPISQIIEMLRVHPDLPIMQIYEKVKKQ